MYANHNLTAVNAWIFSERRPSILELREQMQRIEVLKEISVLIFSLLAHKHLKQYTGFLPSTLQKLILLPFIF